MIEYEEFQVEVDVALLPIYYDTGFGEINESLAPILQIVETLQPEYCIPTHWFFSDNEIFIDEYIPLVEDDCEFINLEFFHSHVFEIP